MGSHMQNKISMDVAADSSSLDSLSFAGLVCIQDQQSKSPTDRAYQNNKDDQEFEFVSGTSPHHLKKNPHPDMTISDNHLLPLEFLLKPAQFQSDNKPGCKQSRPPSLGSSETPIDYHANHTEVIKSNQEAENQVKKERTVSRSWFGEKLFLSFVSPCKECKAVRPTMKAHTEPQQSTEQV